MKNLNVFWSVKLLTMVLILFAFFACEKENVEPINDGNVKQQVVLPEVSYNVTTEPIETVICGEVDTINFMAGQHIDIGEILVYNDETSLYITLQTEDDWVFGQTHLFVGNYEDVPLNNGGNPKVGKFPIKDDFGEPGVDFATYVFDLGELDSCITIAVHAEVYNEDEGIDPETAWASGDRFNEPGNWAMYFGYCRQECIVD